MTTAERWQQIERFFNQALTLPPAERDRWLRDACGTDTRLLEEVGSLLAADGKRAADDLDRPVHAAIVSFDRQHVHRRIGPYELLEQIGSGGMGAVYKARRVDEEYHSTVAIKLVRPGMDTDFILARFRRERQTLARLSHPSIARLLDGGTADDGIPYIVMEFIDGVWITDYCHTRRLSLRQRLELFLPVCSAVDYAHRNFIVHRDIKPGNILIDQSGVPKLLDFGVCKLLHQSTAESEDTATEGLALMTPGYASPEQVRGESISPKSDVYSLGTVLYELLTGVRAHRVDSSTPSAIEEAICLRPVPAPSIAAKDAATARRLAGDLDSILLCALEKDPERRYVSAAALADDLRRHLDDLPIHARADTAFYRVRKFTRRHRPLVAAVGGGLIVLGTGTVVAIQQGRQGMVRDQQLRTLVQQSDLMQRTLMLDGLQLGDVSRDSGQTARASDLYRRSMRLAEGLMAGGDASARRAFVTAARELAALDMRDGHDDAALALLMRAVPVAQASASQAGDTVAMTERALVPRLYQSLATVHARLGHRDEAGKWHQLASQTWQTLATQPGFPEPLRREMDAVESLP